MILQGLIITWKSVDTSDILRLKLSYAYFRTNSLCICHPDWRKANKSFLRNAVLWSFSTEEDSSSLWDFLNKQVTPSRVFQWTNLLWALNEITGHVCIRNLSFACSPAQYYMYTITKNNLGKRQLLMLL